MKTPRSRERGGVCSWIDGVECDRHEYDASQGVTMAGDSRTDAELYELSCYRKWRAGRTALHVGAKLANECGAACGSVNEVRTGAAGGHVRYSMG